MNTGFSYDGNGLVSAIHAAVKNMHKGRSKYVRILNRSLDKLLSV